MPTAVDNITRNQITMLESGLKSLKQSKLITSRELRDMYSAIDNHHRDVRLAHLTGKPKDLLEQAKQDTKFYYILTKMLKEVLIGTHREQQDNLREVYSWYQSNKHILHSAPRFGKQKEKKSAKSSKERIKSASSRPQSGVTDVSSSPSRVRPGSSNLAKLGHIQKQASEALSKEMVYETDLHELEKLHTLQEHRRNGGASYQSGDMSVPMENTLSATMSNFDSASSPDFTSSATKRISEPYQHLLPKRTPQPLSHMYNPHAREMDGAQGDGQSVQLSLHTVGHGGTSEPKSQNMRKWEQFQQQFTYGQDILSKLAHCGRTGVAGGVRYIAHEGGLAAEYMTPIVVSSYAQAQKKEQPKKEPVKNILLEKSLEEFYNLSDGYYPAHLPKYPSFSRAKSASSTSTTNQNPPQLQQLEDTALIDDGASHISHYSAVSSTRKAASEPETDGESVVLPLPPTSPVSVKPQSVVKFEEPIQQRQEYEEQEQLTKAVNAVVQSNEDQKKQVKLDTVVHMIDSVTEEMTHYKEKLLPDPQPGFRLPIQEVDPNERPQTAPLTGTVARPSSPLCDDDRPGTVASAATAPPNGIFPPRISSAGQESYYNRLPSPPNSHYGGGQYKPRRPDSRASVALTEFSENRGKIAPDESRYNKCPKHIRKTTKRWQETPFGGRTFYRKRPGSSLRSAGKARVPAGGRPKTAPQTPRERWATSNPSEDNKKPAVAASHTTTEVEEEVMDHMFEIRHLGGKYGRQRRRYFFDFRPDSRERPYSSMTASTPAMEYLSFIAPKPVSRASSAVPRSMGSAMDGNWQSGMLTSSDGDEEEEDDESMDSMGNDLDLPDVDDLDDDLGDFQYEGDQMPEESFPDDDQFGIDDTQLDDKTDPTTESDGNLFADDNELKQHFDEQETSKEDLDQFEETSEGNQNEEDSEADFDSVNIQSSEQESDSRIDIEQQVTDSRRLIDEINDLVHYEGRPRELRPVSSHSRVTFQEDKLGEVVNETSKAEHSETAEEGGRKVLKPKSILVPRHIQPPPNVGLTIVQFNRGDQAIDSGRDSHIAHKPLSAQTDTHSTLLKPEQNLTPGELDLQLEGVVSSPRVSTAIKPRQFSHSFPKPVTPHPPAEQDLGLSVHGISGGQRQRIRSAGSAPMRARSVNHQRVLQRQREMLRNAPAVAHRTAPSIPSSHHPYGSGPPGAAKGGAPFMPELEQHARRDTSPRNYMQKVGGLRNKNDLMWVPSKTEKGDNGLLTTTLRVARIQPGGRSNNMSPVEKREGYPGTPVSYFEDDKASVKSELKTEIELQASEEGTVLSNDPAVNGGKVTRIHLYHGRPIPDYGEAKTPEEYEAAMRIQQEAKAAVDIQRIFRGFLVRQNYNYLKFEERKKKEDQRKAAIEIQKAYRGHMVRKKKIYNRPDITPETIVWARTFKDEQIERQRRRDYKAFEVAEKNAKNKAVADAKISVIGPHVDVYVPFHPKKTGPDKAVLNLAATCIQRHMRGWIIRKKFDKIKRKAKQHASSWPRFITQYRDLLRRVQSRHGIARPECPFHFDDINDFMDTKKRYESGFEGQAYAGELEFDDLMDYFHECDLFPSQSDTDHAMDLVFREPMFAVSDADDDDTEYVKPGQDLSKKRGLQRHQVMELTFHLYPPAATGITNSRQSTWMNPIIDGEEAIKLLGTDGVEPTDFETVWKFVASTRKAQQEAIDQAEKGKRDEEHARLMEAKRKRDIELRNELRKMGHAGYRGSDYAKKKTLLESAEDEENNSTTPKKDRKVHFPDEVPKKEATADKSEDVQDTEAKEKDTDSTTESIKS